MKKTGKNKGAAMISVLIAITFIGILSTSLLYMAYANYMTKVVRYNSQDNFYSAEFGLDELSASLKQVAYQETDSNDAMDALVNAIDPNHDNKFSDNSAAIVANLMKTSNQDVDFEIFHDSYINPGITAEYEADYSNARLTIYGIKIVATGKSGTVREGYKSNVALNLIIKFPFNAKKGSPALSDFSLISDSPFNSAQGGDVFFTGCVYLQGVGKNGVNPAPATDPYAEAIVVEDGMACFQGYQNIINGDVLIKKGGILTINGDLLVNGKIDIKSGGALICSGKVQTACGINADSGSYMTNGVSTAADNSLSWNNLPDNSIKGGTKGTGGGITTTPARYRAYANDGAGGYFYKEYEDPDYNFYSVGWTPIPAGGFPDPDPAKAITYETCVLKCGAKKTWEAGPSDSETIQLATYTETPSVGGSEGLANALFAKYIVVMDQYGNPMCLHTRGMNRTGISYGTPTTYNMAAGNAKLAINGDGGGEVHVESGASNVLFMNLANSPISIRGTVLNSMFLSETEVKQNDRSLPVYMQKMDETLYQSMLDSYWIQGTGSIQYDNAQLEKTKYSDAHGCDTGTDCSGQKFYLTDQVQDSRGSIYGGTTAIQKQYNIKYFDELGNAKTIRRTFEYLDDGNYTNLIQIKNFLAEDPSAAINKVFGAVYTSTSDTVPANKNSVVTYEKWFKNKD